MDGHDDALINRHEGVFREFDTRLRKLEVDMSRLQADHVRVMVVVDGDGEHLGVREMLTNFMSKAESRDKAVKETLDSYHAKEREDRDARDKKVDRKQNWVLIVITLFGILISAVELFKH